MQGGGKQGEAECERESRRGKKEGALTTLRDGICITAPMLAASRARRACVCVWGGTVGAQRSRRTCPLFFLAARVDEFDDDHASTRRRVAG